MFGRSWKKYQNGLPILRQAQLYARDRNGRLESAIKYLKKVDHRHTGIKTAQTCGMPFRYIDHDGQPDVETIIEYRGGLIVTTIDEYVKRTRATVEQFQTKMQEIGNRTE